MWTVLQKLSGYNTNVMLGYSMLHPIAFLPISVRFIICLYPSVVFKQSVCSTAKRPPVEETSSFLQSLLASHGPNYLEKLFGSKARDALAPLGGVDKVAITLSGSHSSTLPLSHL